MLLILQQITECGRDALTNMDLPKALTIVSGASLSVGDKSLTLRPHGTMSDIAPTILSLLGLPAPPEMTGISLLNA